MKERYLPMEPKMESRGGIEFGGLKLNISEDDFLQEVVSRAEKHPRFENFRNKSGSEQLTVLLKVTIRALFKEISGKFDFYFSPKDEEDVARFAKKLVEMFY